MFQSTPGLDSNSFYQTHHSPPRHEKAIKIQKAAIITIYRFSTFFQYSHALLQQNSEDSSIDKLQQVRRLVEQK